MISPSVFYAAESSTAYSYPEHRKLSNDEKQQALLRNGTSSRNRPSLANFSLPPLSSRMSLSLLPGNTAGSRSPNGSWTGMMGELQSGTAQLAVNRVTMSSTRSKAIAFSMPALSTRACLFARSDALATTVHWMAYLEPLEGALWCAAALLIVSFAVALSMTRWQSPEKMKSLTAAARPYVTDAYVIQNSHPPSVADRALLTWGAFCGQSFGQQPQTVSARLVFAFMYLTALTLLSAYSATLVAHLAIRHYHPPFKGLDGMLENRKYEMGVTARSGVFSVFQGATDPLMKKVYYELLEPNLASLPNSRLEGLRRVCKDSHYVFMVTQDFLMGLQDKYDCQVIPVPDTCFPINLGLAMSLDAGLESVVGFQLQHMRESGLLRALYRQKWPQALHRDGPQPPRVFLHNVVPLFAALVTGSAVAGAVLLIELLLHTLRSPGLSTTPPLVASTVSSFPLQSAIGKRTHSLHLDMEYF